MSVGNFKFGTTVNCMDGRSIEYTIAWMKASYHLDYVDAITEPGMDAYELGLTDEKRAWLKRKLEISIQNHGSRVISIVGHEDCAGNPVTKETHIDDIHHGISLLQELIKEIDPSIDVIVLGLWAFPENGSPRWTIEKV